MLSSGMITRPFFVFPENFTHTVNSLCDISRVLSNSEITHDTSPPLAPRDDIAPKGRQMLLKWKSFADESIKFKKSNWVVTTTNALDIHVAKPCLVHAGILLFSTTLCL
jgi:hypothetical protein